MCKTDKRNQTHYRLYPNLRFLKTKNLKSNSAKTNPVFCSYFNMRKHLLAVIMGETKTVIHSVLGIPRWHAGVTLLKSIVLLQQQCQKMCAVLLIVLVSARNAKTKYLTLFVILNMLKVVNMEKVRSLNMVYFESPATGFIVV